MTAGIVLIGREIVAVLSGGGWCSRRFADQPG
jgi:hypothetical protein